jgi:ketose-bisphosphate aldolase
MKTTKRSSTDIAANARANNLAIPALNIPHLPIMESMVRALRDTDTFGFIEVARPEWEKFEAKSIVAIREEYERVKDEDFTRLHLDHVPVIDEDHANVDYMAIIKEALDLGYDSVMVDGSRLGLEDNIDVTAKVVNLAHAAGIPVEAELGAVMGHEDGPMPPYEELFATGKGFTDPDEAERFVKETDVDWLSVAFGSIHGAISSAGRSEKKVEARLNNEHLARLYKATGIPLVLHGGSGIRKSDVLESMRQGITKINVGTVVRQAYERTLEQSVEEAQQAVYELAKSLFTNEYELAGTASKVLPRE